MRYKKGPGPSASAAMKSRITGGPAGAVQAKDSSWQPTKQLGIPSLAVGTEGMGDVADGPPSD